MRTRLVALGLFGLALWGCGSGGDNASSDACGHDAGPPDASETEMNEDDAIEPPPPGAIFTRFQVPVAFAMDGTPIRFETRFLFDDARLRALCLLPDADSFDDYEEVDPTSDQVIIPRGTTPLSTSCPADGIVTGPLHDELFPSSWCRIEHCTPGDDSAGNEDPGL